MRKSADAIGDMYSGDSIELFSELALERGSRPVPDAVYERLKSASIASVVVCKNRRTNVQIVITRIDYNSCVIS